MPVQVAIPYLEDEGRNRTISSYGQEYSPVYVENMKRHLGEKLGEIRRYNRGETDPLEMPVGFDAGSGIAALTKNQMLKALGKGAALIDRPRYLYNKAYQEANPEGVWRYADKDKELIGRVKSAANEIRSAPDRMFEFVNKFRVDKDIGGSYHNSAEMSINADKRDLGAKVIRHELYHNIMSKIFPEHATIYSDEANQSRHLAEVVKDFGFGKKVQEAFPHATYLHLQHGYNPEEIAAIGIESVPLSKYKGLSHYMKDAEKRLYEGSIEANKRRMSVAKEAIKKFDAPGAREDWKKYLFDLFGD